MKTLIVACYKGKGAEKKRTVKFREKQDGHSAI